MPYVYVLYVTFVWSNGNNEFVYESLEEAQKGLSTALSYEFVECATLVKE